MNDIKIALPKGRLMADTAALLHAAGWGIGGYEEGLRSYRLSSPRFPQVKAKVFNERDIPIQVAMGNYDLGVCGQDWIEELTVKYPSAGIVRIRDLGYGRGTLYAVAADNGAAPDLASIIARQDAIRLAAEYPNLAESFALKLRMRRFSVFPLWGGAEVYPPESADLALLSGRPGMTTEAPGLSRVETILEYGACLIANKSRWGTRDLSDVLASIEEAIAGRKARAPADMPAAGSVGPPVRRTAPTLPITDAPVRLALPDGHQQAPTVALLERAGIRMHDYPSQTGNRRPTAESLPGVSVKVIRPQDMPLQVAAGNFDLAVTGIDWLNDHLCQFPSSPAAALLDLKLARVRIVAVVSNDLPVSNGYELKEFWARRPAPIRIAAEYVNIADKYARDNHLGHYRIIPTWGATEAFIPEDADLMVENTETGRTIARNNLKIIDTIFESTGHLIGNRESLKDTKKRAIMESLADRLRRGVEGSPPRPGNGREELK